MATRLEHERINEEAKKLLFFSDTERLNIMRAILDCTTELEDQFIFICFYIYGLRPSELIQMKRGWVSFKDGEIWISIPTTKHGDERIIILDNSVPFMDIFERFVSPIMNMEERFFRFNAPTNFNKRIDKMLKRYNQAGNGSMKITPYVFRKFRLSWLLANGASGSDLLAYKGGKSLRPLEKSYIFMRPVSKFKESLK
jgi:integrase